VAGRTTLDANIKTIVDTAIADMDALVTDAQAKPNWAGGRAIDLRTRRIRRFG